MHGRKVLSRQESQGEQSQRLLCHSWLWDMMTTVLLRERSDMKGSQRKVWYQCEKKESDKNEIDRITAKTKSREKK